jgi:hypothetical protein
MKTELVGQGAVGRAMALPRGTYDVAMTWDLPRAQVVQWTLACAGAEDGERRGSAGQTFADYRERKLAQLRADRERERKNVAAATSLLVGAVAPRAQVQARSPDGSATGTASVGVDANAVGNGVAQGVVAEAPLELAPGDVGQGRVVDNVRIVTATPGDCTVTASAEDPAVIGTFVVSRIRNLDEEARVARVQAQQGAIAMRSTVTAHLVAQGADPEARQRRLAAEATERARIAAQREAHEAEAARIRFAAENKARIEREAQLRVELEARRKREAAARVRMEAQVALQARIDAEAYGVRALWVRYLVVMCHGDPNARARRFAAEQAAIRTRGELAIRSRVEMRGYLLQLGAREIPPMPAMIVEDRSAPPMEGWEWTAGAWTFNRARWMWEWTAGSWRDNTRFGSSSTGEVRAVPEATATAATATTVTTETTDTAGAGDSGFVRVTAPTVPVVITVGTDGGPRPPVVVPQPPRSSRPAPPPPPKPPETGPTVRDHRHK